MRRHVNRLPSVRGERLDAVFWLDRTCICNVAFACFAPHNILGKFCHIARNDVNKQASMRICEALSLPLYWIIFLLFSSVLGPAWKVSCLTNFKLKVKSPGSIQLCMSSSCLNVERWSILIVLCQCTAQHAMMGVYLLAIVNLLFDSKPDLICARPRLCS